MTDPLTPPGKGHIVPCPECHGEARRSCYECHGEGVLLRRACPLCGDLSWDYVNGMDETAGMTCLLGCGYHWWADDRGWSAQVLPTEPA